MNTNRQLQLAGQMPQLLLQPLHCQDWQLRRPITSELEQIVPPIRVYIHQLPLLQQRLHHAMHQQHSVPLISVLMQLQFPGRQ